MPSKKLDRAEIQPAAAPSGSVVDPVCGMSVLAASAAASTEFAGTRYWFCSAHCHETFLGDAPRYAKGAIAAQPCPEHAAAEHDHLHAPAVTNAAAPSSKQLAKDPICGMLVNKATALSRERGGAAIIFAATAACAPSSRRKTS